MLNKIKLTWVNINLFHCKAWWWTDSHFILFPGLLKIIALSALGSATHFIECMGRLSGDGCLKNFCTWYRKKYPISTSALFPNSATLYLTVVHQKGSLIWSLNVVWTHAMLQISFTTNSSEVFLPEIYFLTCTSESQPEKHNWISCNKLGCLSILIRMIGNLFSQWKS